MALHPLPRKPRNREIELDFLRGIAILMVLLFHLRPNILLTPFAPLGFVNFGWAGVDIFFVLSGFLVGGLLIKEWQLNLRIDSKRFLIRRGFKIWPQYYFFLLVMLLTGHRAFRALWWNFLNIQNYLGGIAHTWTLALEEHAYLLLLLILSFAARKKIKIKQIFLFIACLAVAVLIWRTILAAHQVNIFSRTDTRIDGILYGVLLAILYHHAPELFGRLQRLTWVWLAIVALALLDFRFTPTTWWSADLTYACADAMGVAALFLVYKHHPETKRSLLYRSVAWIGVYSYGIYLWHISVVAPLGSFAHRFSPRNASIFLSIVPILVAIALGVVMTKLIEFPALALRDRLFPRRIDSAVGLSAKLEKELDVRTKTESTSAEPQLAQREVSS